MNEAEAKHLVHKVLETDRLIHEQVLGVEWTCPSLAFLDRSGPLQLHDQVGCTAHQVAAHVFGSEEEKEETSDGGLEKSTTGLDKKTVKRLLELLCDDAVRISFRSPRVGEGKTQCLYTHARTHILFS